MSVGFVEKQRRRLGIRRSGQSDVDWASGDRDSPMSIGHPAIGPVRRRLGIRRSGQSRREAFPALTGPLGGDNSGVVGRVSRKAAASCGSPVAGSRRGSLRGPRRVWRPDPRKTVLMRESAVVREEAPTKNAARHERRRAAFVTARDYFISSSFFTAVKWRNHPRSSRSCGRSRHPSRRWTRSMDLVSVRRPDIVHQRGDDRPSTS